MIKDNNKFLSQTKEAEDTLTHNIMDLRASSPLLSVNSTSTIDFININDVSELKKIELELKIEELENALKKAETIAALYDLSSSGFFTLTLDGTIEHLNENASAMLGEDHSLNIQKNLREYLSTASIAVFDDFLQRAFSTGTKQTCELTFITKRHPADFNYAYVEGVVSGQERCLLTAINIGDQKEADILNGNTERDQEKESVSTSEACYRRLFESSKDGIVILDAANRHLIDVNPFFCHLLGYTQDEIINKPLWELGIFNSTSDSEAVFNELHDKEYIRYDNMLLSAKNGRPVYVELTGNIYLVGRKKVVQFTIRNITERIKAEKEIHTLRKAIQQGPSAITITNADRKIEFVNNKFIELTQYQPADVMGKEPRIFNKGHLPANQYAELWETLSSGRTWEGKVMNRRKDRTYFWEETTISAVKNLDGTISNYILIQNDISEKQQIIHDLILAKEKAIEGDLLKTAFLANMSHEIRTPLNSIIGFSELMADDEFDTNQLSYFAKIINSSGNKLLSIISDIMDLSRIEAGEIKAEKRRLSLNQLITNIQKEYLFKAIEKGLELRIDPAISDLEIFVESDENKLRQILFNFVGNAIKFTENGYVEIGMQKTGDFVHIQVKDTGIGIPADYKDQIFERFRQVESAYSRKYGGNGLGLAISKALVELLGGRVGMETEQGKGSTFYFTIPLA